VKPGAPVVARSSCPQLCPLRISKAAGVCRTRVSLVPQAGVVEGHHDSLGARSGPRSRDTAIARKWSPIVVTMITATRQRRCSTGKRFRRLESGGERGRNRTFNLLIKSQLLCQLSYAPSTGKSSARHFLIVTFLIFLIIAHNASFNGLGSEPRRINLECIDDPCTKNTVG
jgi:hypothetical protein